MDSAELKNYIKENEKIKEILEYCDCHNINDNKDFIRCSLNGKNNNAIGVNKETLYVNDFSNSDLTGDIYYFVMNLKNISFSQCMKELHNLFNLEYNPFNIKKKEKVETIDPLHLFKKIKDNNFDVDIEDLKVYDENILDSFYPYVYEEWIKEGILEPIRKRYCIGFSEKFNRVVIPHRHYETGEIVGVIGRTINELHEELNIPKYFPIIRYSKSNNLYGLFENYFDIQKKKYVVVYEAEKSVMKRSARLDNTGVALGSHSMSLQQAKILKSLNVEIVIAMDNDVKYYDVLKMCENFYPLYNVSFIKDKNEILGKKDSPADTNMKNFDILFKNRIKYDNNWHEMFLKLEDKKNGKKN